MPIPEARHCTHGSLTSSYGWSIQVLLASLAFACLIIKRFFEPKHYRRSWLIWFFDTSKQGFGAIVVHFSNIILAEVIEGPDPCTLYIISFLLDSSIGLIIIYICIRLTQYIAIKYKYDYLIFGEYGTQKLNYWVIQCIAYIIIVLIEKLVITLIIQIKLWDHVRDIILWPLLNQEMEILFVVLVIPFIVNVFIFWVTDNFLIMHRMGILKNENAPNDSVNIGFLEPETGLIPNRINYHNVICDDDTELIDISFEPEETL